MFALVLDTSNDFITPAFRVDVTEGERRLYFSFTDQDSRLFSMLVQAPLRPIFRTVILYPDLDVTDCCTVFRNAILQSIDEVDDRSGWQVTTSWVFEEKRVIISGREYVASGPPDLREEYTLLGSRGVGEDRRHGRSLRRAASPVPGNETRLMWLKDGF